ncbi:uncharacterized protein [Ptychodera flava]|uniref:uncharacterized protein isoform X2 n=1 Tax=Ptychodera flava TaxID=63121 RepID=UPI003969D158
MPNPRSVSNGVPQRVMECSIQNAYQDFIKEYPNLKLSLAKFSKLKPSHIKTQSHAKFLQCQCEYCVNVQFKLDALSVRCAQLGFQITVPNKYSASAMTTCPNDDTFAKISCVHRECEVCGTHLLLEHFKPLLEDHSEKQIKWKKWTAERYTKPSSNTEDQQESRHMVLRVKNGTISEIVNELLAEMEPFTKHLFNAKWQAKEFANICTVVPEKWLVLCSDFGENYNCHFQDEAQSAHWSYQQATIHPIVAYYRCQESECDKTVRESCMFVSSDTKHDYHAVQHFLVLAVEYLRSKGIEIEHQVHFSDGSPTQYKSKVPFCDASHGSTDFGCTVEKHFFGSRHGKGPCDGEIGVLKKRAVTAVKSRQVIIANAEDLYEYGKDHLSLPKEENSHDHKRRKFFFVGADVIDRSRKERTDVKAIPGTRSLHCFKGIQPYVVATRERSCFCQQCVSESAENECLFQEYAGPWTVSSLKPCRVMRQELATIRRNLNRRSGSSDCGPTGEGSGVTKDSGSTSTQLPPSPACPTEANTESENGTTSDVCNVTTGTALASFQGDRPSTPVPVEPSEASTPVPVEPSEASTPVPVESSEASTPVPVEPSEASIPEINSQDDTSVECGNSKSGDDVTTGRVLVSSPEQTCTTNQNEHNVDSGEPTLPMEKLEQVIQLFQFYAVYYSKTYYIGKPTAIQDGLFVFTFLHKMGAREFVWPNREDTDNISRDRIFGGPIPLIGQGLKFQIQRQTLNELQCQYKKLKKQLK